MSLIDTLLSQANINIRDLKPASGKGVDDVFAKELSQPEFDFVDNKEEIIVEFQLKNICTHPLDLIEVKIQSLSVEVKVKEFADADHYFKICRLHDEINVKKSKYVIATDTIQVTLVKLKRGEWNCLYYYHPDVYKNFQDKVKTAIKTLPFKNTRREHVRADHECPSESIENMALCGMDVLSSYFESPSFFKALESSLMCKMDVLSSNLESPSVLKSLEQIIEDLKIECQNPHANFKVVLCLCIRILVKEIRDYEDSHPEALRLYESKKERENKEEMKKKTEKQIKAETLKLEGNRFIKNEKYMEAIESYTEAISLDPECPVYYLNRAIAYYNIGVYTLSLENAAQALSINPFYCKAYYYLGECLLHDCIPKDALYAFQRAKILEPFNRKIDDKLFETYKFSHNLHMFVECVRENNEEGREKHLKELLKVMDYSICAERLFKHLCDKGMIAEARVEAKKLGKIHKYKYIELYFLAICEYYEDNEEKFNEHFKEYKKAQEKSLIGYPVEGYELCDNIADMYASRHKGDEMYEKGCYEKAVEFYFKALSNTDIVDNTPLPSSKILFKIALAKREIKDEYPLYMVFIEESLRLKKDNHEALAARGEYLLHEGMFDLALSEFTTAQGIHPCRRYAELIAKAKAKERPEDASAASGRGKGRKNKKVCENRRKAIKKKERK